MAAIPAQTRQVIALPGSTLGVKVSDRAAAIQLIKQGFSYQKLDRFQRASLLPMETIAKVIQLPPRTRARRQKLGKLSPSESERLLRLAILFEKATNLFEGNGPAARTWLSAPCKALGMETPLAAAETELGARAVEDLIGQLEHGVFP